MIAELRVIVARVKIVEEWNAHTSRVCVQDVRPHVFRIKCTIYYALEDIHTCRHRKPGAHSFYDGDNSKSNHRYFAARSNAKSRDCIDGIRNEFREVIDTSVKPSFGIIVL